MDCISNYEDYFLHNWILSLELVESLSDAQRI